MSDIVIAAKEETPFRRFAREFAESKLALLGFIVVVVIALLALFASWIAPQNPYDLAQLDIMDGRLPPGSRSADGFTFWLGSDDQGRDMLSGILYGLRISLGVGIGSAVIAGIIGSSLGLLAAYAGGKTETAIMRLVDLQLSFPAILVALMILAGLGKGVLNVTLALVIVEWARYARTARAAALVERGREYIEAAECLALPRWRLVFLPSAAELPAAADRHRHHPDRYRHHAGGDAVLPRPRRADHRALARPADRQRLPVHAVGQILDQLLSRHRAAGDHRRHQPGRRPAARRAQSPAAPMSDMTLDVRNLRTHFFTRAGVVRAVDDVSFTVRRGRVLGLVGESGSGKTVTGFSILGLVDPPGRIAGGSILFQGIDLAKLSEPEMRDLRGNRIAMIFQDPMMTLNPVLRIDTQMIETVQAHARVSRAEARARSRDALGMVGIPSPDERLQAYPHQFSGGMRQRVAIAIALLHRPDLIVADEPTTALDVTIQAQILAEVQKLSATYGTALIWITHDLSVVAGLADEIAVMYAGRIVETGDVGTVLDRPLHPYTQGLIGSVPSRNKRGSRLRQIPGMTPSLLDLPKGCAFRTRCARADAACEQDPEITEPVPGHRLRCFHPLLETVA